MPSPIFQKLIDSGESEQVEFIAAATAFQPIGKAVCGFLNAKGGTLVVGVDDKGKVLGVDDSGTRSQEIQNHLMAKVSPMALWSVSTENRSGKPLIVVDVPQGTETPYIYDDTIYVRLGAAVKKASGAEITELIERRHTQPIRWERIPALGLEVADLDSGEILRTAEDGDRKRGYRFRDVTSETTVLEDLNLCRGGIPRNSAVVLFGKNPAQHYSQLRVRLARFKGEREVSFQNSRVLEGNAFVLVDQIEGFFRQHVEIASELPKSGVRRTDVPAYPFPALREAMMNALVHRDYSAFDGGISISIYDDRIEIWNSGGLPDGMTLRELKEERVSRPRNPDLAHVFWLRGLIERYGIGAGLIIEECRRAGLPEPEWKLGGSGVTLTIRSRRTAGLPASGDLNSRQIDFLARVGVGSQIDIGKYSEEFAKGVSRRQARTDLAQLTAAGYLRRQGRGPSTIYIRTDKDL